MSKIGTLMSTSGTASVKPVAVFEVAWIDSAPIRNPIVRLPPSPMKILAGGQLWIKKPTRLPAAMSANVAAPGWP